MPSLRLLVVGASQGTGALTVSAALARGHQVTAFARSPQKLTIEHASLTKRAGSFHDAAAVDAAVVGHWDSPRSVDTRTMRPVWPRVT